MGTLISHSAAETIALGQRWAAECGPGWVFGLDGDLGAGKTQLAKGLALGLGITERVHSPTFVLVHEYTGGRWPLFHLDLYRLETAEACWQAGLEDYLRQARGVTVVEWFDHWARHQPAGAAWLGPHQHLRRVTFTTLDATTRQFTYEDTCA